MQTSSIRRLVGLALLMALAVPQPAHAYIGPGAGAGAIAVTVAVLLGIVLLLAGFVWYPIKRRLKGRKQGSARQDTGARE